MTDPTVAYTDDTVTLFHGDCLEVLTTIPNDHVDAIVTDPPYGLDFMGKAWDRYTPRDFQRWCEGWATECLRVLKPGGHMLAFGGSRTWHRLTAGIEDAGFEIRDSIAWLYASGFPKSLDVTDAVTKWQNGEGYDAPEKAIRAGVYEVTAFLKTARDKAGWTNRMIDDLFGTNGMSGHWVSSGSQPAVPSPRQWAVLKERLGFDDSMDTLVAELGSTERPEDWGEGDGDSAPFLASLGRGQDVEPAGGWGTALKPAYEPVVVARKPLAGTVSATVLTYGTGALNIDGCRTHMSEADRELFEKGRAAWKEHGERHGTDGHKAAVVYGEYGLASNPPAAGGRWPANVTLDDHAAAQLDGALGDDGPSRFFPRFRFQAKAPTSERPRYWRHVCDCDHDTAARAGAACPTCGTPYELTTHPTVKPLDLMRWLVRLVTPAGGTVLEPFTGSGTTLEAAILEGFRAIGIEREADYLPLIEARITKPLQPVLDLGGLSA